MPGKHRDCQPGSLEHLDLRGSQAICEELSVASRCLPEPFGPNPFEREEAARWVVERSRILLQALSRRRFEGRPGFHESRQFL